MLDFFLDDNDPEQMIKTNNAGSGEIARVFNVINENLSTELVSKIGAIYKFNVKGNFFSFILI